MKKGRFIHKKWLSLGALVAVLGFTSWFSKVPYPLQYWLFPPTPLPFSGEWGISQEDYSEINGIVLPRFSRGDSVMSITAESPDRVEYRSFETELTGGIYNLERRNGEWEIVGTGGWWWGHGNPENSDY